MNSGLFKAAQLFLSDCLRNIPVLSLRVKRVEYMWLLYARIWCNLRTEHSVYHSNTFRACNAYLTQSEILNHPDRKVRKTALVPLLEIVVVLNKTVRPPRHPAAHET